MASGTRAPSDWSRAVAAQIRAERAATGLTQAQVIERSEMARTTYLRVEDGTRPVDMTQIEAISRALGISVTTLVARAEQRAEQRV